MRVPNDRYYLCCFSDNIYRQVSRVLSIQNRPSVVAPSCAMLTPRPGPIAVAVGAIVILIIFVTSAIHYRPEEAAHYRSKIFGAQSHTSPANEGLRSVWNETLGVSRSSSASRVHSGGLLCK